MDGWWIMDARFLEYYFCSTGLFPAASLHKIHGCHGMQGPPFWLPAQGLSGMSPICPPCSKGFYGVVVGYGGAVVGGCSLFDVRCPAHSPEAGRVARMVRGKPTAAASHCRNTASFVPWCILLQSYIHIHLMAPVCPYGCRPSLWMHRWHGRRGARISSRPSG